jgi:hypothetical protein
VSLDSVNFVKVQGPEEVVQDAVEGDGGQVPAKNVENNHFPFLKDGRERELVSDEVIFGSHDI